MSADEQSCTQTKRFFRFTLTPTTGQYPLLSLQPNVNSMSPCEGSSSATAAASSQHSSWFEETQSDTANIHKLQAKVLMLEQQKKELLSINSEWANHYKVMEECYREKFNRIKASQEENDEQRNIRVHGGIKESSRIESEHSTNWADLMKAREEIVELKRQNSIVMDRWERQHGETAKLITASEEEIREAQTLQDVWKQQAEIYKEDFMKEQQEKERLRTKNQMLEDKFKKMSTMPQGPITDLTEE